MADERPPEFYETGTLPTAEEVLRHCSPASLKLTEERLAALKKHIEKVRAERAKPRPVNSEGSRWKKPKIETLILFIRP